MLFLLLTAMVLSVFAGAGECEAEVPAFNSSGNRNVQLSVDPIWKSEGFSAVLYDNRNGMPTSAANAIAQTEEGFIWIGSYAGLIRYDGNTFERVGSTRGIANIRTLFTDSRDRLWIGTNDVGVFVMENGEFLRFDRTDGLPSVSIRAFAEDGDGMIYVSCASAGVMMIDRDYKLTALQDERINRQSTTLRTGEDGRVYGLTQGGDLFTVRNGEILFFLSAEESRIKNIISILPDPSRPGCLYVSTGASRIYYGNPERNFTAMNLKNIDPLTSVVSMEYIDGQIWLCGVNGIGVLDSTGFHLLQNVPLTNNVEHVMTDYEGNLWFTSSRQGLLKIVPNQFGDLFARYGLPAAVVNTTCLFGKQLFIGTDTGLIVTENGNRLNSLPLSGAVTASGTELEATDLLKLLDGVRIRSILRDSKGQLWISTWRKHGLLCYDGEGVTAYTPEDGLLSDMPRAVSECEDGTILVANTGGLSVIKDGRVTATYGEEDGLVNIEILTVTEGFNREMVLGSDGGGIYIIGPDGIKQIGAEEGLSSGVVMRIKRSERYQVYWIVSGNSLAYMTPDYRVTTAQNFPYPNNFDLYENSRGELWVLSSTGIFEVPAAQLLANGTIDPVFYGIHNGLPYMPTANSYSALSDEGDLYIAGSSGVVKVNIENPFEKISQLKVSLPYVEADGVRYYADAAGRFTLPGTTRMLTVTPYVFNYLLIDPQVTYRLDGLEETSVTVSRSELKPIIYTSMRSGTYRFVMQVKDSAGDDSTTASFTIVKERLLSDRAIGTVILDVASLLSLYGILVYTSLYRKRDRIDDRMFLYMAVMNIALSGSELISHFFAAGLFRSLPALVHLDYIILYAVLSFFPYFFLMYLDYRLHPHRERLRKIKLWVGIPFFLLLLLLTVNLFSGWLYTIGPDNAYHAGPLRLALFVPIAIYFIASLPAAYKINPRIVLLGILLVLARAVGYIWFGDISSVAFTYTVLLICVHIISMNRSIAEEET